MRERAIFVESDAFLPALQHRGTVFYAGGFPTSVSNRARIGDPHRPLHEGTEADA